MQINLLLSIAIIFFFKFFKNFFLSIIKTIKKKPLVKKYFSLLTRILSVQSSNGIAILFYKNPVICKKSKFQRKSKKKKKKKTFDLVPIKKYIFSRNETKPRNLSPFTRSIRAIFSLPPPLFLFFTLVRCLDYLDCRIGWTNLLPINRVSEWSGSPLIAADTRYFCAIPNRFSSVVIVHALRHSGRPSIPFQFVPPTRTRV